MNTSHSVTVVALFATTLLLQSIGRAQDPAICEQVATHVTQSVEKEPQKVLVIVEDNMVAHETCACEIVKAAIRASKADTELVKQIVQTAVHVAPNQAALIAECASAVTPDHSKAVVDTVKGVTGVQPMEPSISEPTSESDYNRVPSDVRGVYLVSPSTGGIATTTTSVTTTTTEENPKKSKKTSRHRSRTNHSVPQSPSVATISE